MDASQDGKRTGISLSDVSPLTAPPFADAHGVQRPALSRSLLCLSARLAADTYRLDLSDWAGAGWMDGCAAVQHVIAGGLTPQGGSLLDRAAGEIRIRAAQLIGSQNDALGAMAGAIHQLWRGGGCKAVAMTHEAGDGRFAVALSFMGSLARLEDWAVNLNMTPEEGFHQGYLRQVTAFEEDEDRVLFPETAARLGLPRLSLRDILEACAGEDSPFRLFVTGHSAGAALAQIWLHRKISRDGVLPAHVTACGMASPSVCFREMDAPPDRLPMVHLLNSDDPVPAMGALVHLGVLLQYPADQRLAEACYRGLKQTDPELLRDALALLRRMSSTPRDLEMAAAILLETRGDKAAEAIISLQQDNLFVRLLAIPGGLGVNAAGDEVFRRIQGVYREITGEPMSDRRLLADQNAIRAAAGTAGLVPLLTAMGRIAGATHRCQDGAEGPAAYPWIAAKGYDRLRAMIWRWRDGQPRRMAYDSIWKSIADRTDTEG